MSQGEQSSAFRRVTVVGAGAFGFALALHLSRTRGVAAQVRLHDADRGLLARLGAGRQHPRLREQALLPQSIAIHRQLGSALEDAELAVLAVPGRVVGSAAAQIAAAASPELPLLSVAKALDRESGQRLGEVVHEARGAVASYAALAGGMIANELLAGRPLGATVGSVDSRLAQRIVRTLSGPGLYLETSTDVIGVELAGALKNVLSIGAGLLEGLGYPLGSRTLFLSRATAEVQRLAVALGADAQTFSMTSQCWGNDMILSTLGRTRNRAFGEALAAEVRQSKGGLAAVSNEAVLSPVLVERVRRGIEGESGTVEGFHTAAVLHRLLERAEVEASRLTAIAELLAGRCSLGAWLETIVDPKACG